MSILFSNCSLKDENLDLELRSPYNLILESSISGNWRPQLVSLRTFNWKAIQLDLGFINKHVVGVGV